MLKAADAGRAFDVEIDPAGLLVPVRLAQPGLLDFGPERGLRAISINLADHEFFESL